MNKFYALIDKLNAAPAADRGRVEQDIWSIYGVEKAILALDMSQFSLSVRRSGILPYVGLIRRMQVLTGPIVDGHNGEVVKYVADNMMAVFDDASDAVNAAVAINRSLIATPIVTDAASLSVAIGIDYGRFVLIPGQDCFGDPVNIAYKLGEDLARPGEVLISASAREQLDASLEDTLVEQQVSVSGLQFLAYRVGYN